MGKFKELSDFEVFSPLLVHDTDNNIVGVQFAIENFNDMIVSVEAGIIFEINEGKKTMSNKVVEKMFKYLDGEVTEDDVLASLKEHKKTYGANIMRAKSTE